MERGVENQKKRSLQDSAVIAMVKFFRADWSGAFLAILILGIAIELATTGRPFFHPSNLMTILNNSAAIGAYYKFSDRFNLIDLNHISLKSKVIFSRIQSLI